MEKIKLNQNIDVNVKDYRLDPLKEYVIDIESETEEQVAIILKFKMVGLPDAIEDYHKWLEENGFDVEFPNPTNEFVKGFYGKKPLWVTERSQGLVVRSESEDKYFIVMEFVRPNDMYSNNQLILTLGGCM